MAEIDHLKQERKKAIARILLLMLGFCGFGLIGSLAFIFMPESNYRDLLILIIGLLAVYFLSVIPHYYAETLRFRIELKNNIKVWEIVDQHGKTIASYHTFEDMVENNHHMFKPIVNQQRYSVVNANTGECKGMITVKETHHWKPTNEETSKPS